MNLVVLRGNLVRDPEVRVVEGSGGRKTSVANFSIAVSRSFKKADGERQKETIFVDCEAWDTGAETLGKYVVKGDPILVRGSLKSDSWTDKESGNKRSRMKVRVEQFDRLYRAPTQPENENTVAESTPATETETPELVATASKGDPGF